MPAPNALSALAVEVAASLGQSRMSSDDLAQLKAGIALYDAFCRWARDAVDEPHNWPTNSRKVR